MKLYKVKLLWKGSGQRAQELIVVSDISEVFDYYKDKPVVVENIKWKGYATVLSESEVSDSG